MIGVDIARIARVGKAVESKPFRDRVFTAEEQRYCDGKPNPSESYAGIFCAKEACRRIKKFRTTVTVRPCLMRTAMRKKSFSGIARTFLFHMRANMR